MSGTFRPLLGNRAPKKCRIDGHFFASKREASRYKELRLLVDTGAIQQLELQPIYHLFAGVPASIKSPQRAVPLPKRLQYRADFRYVDCSTGNTVVEDVKTPATRTSIYVLKKALVEATYGITIVEV